MAKGISIGIASDTREFATGVKKGVIEPLEGASDALDDVARDGSKAGDKLERAFKDAQGEVSDFKKEQSELAKAMSKASKKGSDDWADNSKKGFSKAEDAASSFKDEAKQNFAETASSFDGSMDSIADMAQGTLGGLATSIAGPIGIAVAGAGAIGGAVFAGIQANAEKSEERVSEMYDAFVESGLKYLTAEQRISKLGELLEDEENIRTIKEASVALGLEEETVTLSLLEKGRERLEVESAIAAKRKELEKAPASNAVDLAQLKLWEDIYDRLNDDQVKATQLVDLYNKSVQASNKSMAEQGRLVDETGKKIAELPATKGITVKYNVDDSALKQAEARFKKMSVNVDYNGGRPGKRII